MRVGYYDLEAGQGVAAQSDLIASIGQTALLLNDIQPADTARAHVLMLQNGNAGGYTLEFGAGASNVVNFVSAGGVAVFHDAATASAATVLAGLGFTGADATPDASGADSQDIDFWANFTPLNQGISGTLDDTSLDGGAPSSYGYISLDSVQDEEVGFLTTRGDPSQGVTVMASLGSGYGIYSTIALGDYLGGSSALDLAMQAYGGNLMRFATRLEKAVDTHLGGAGDTFTVGDPGQDVFGDDGDDVLTITGRRSWVHGGDGNDQITISAHGDMAWGGAGIDTLLGGHADDQLWGGADSDKLKGSQGEDFIVGGSGDDLINGGQGADKMFGGDGDDTLRGGIGTDHYDGGAGADRFIFSSDGVGAKPPAAPHGGPIAELGAASDYVSHFEIGADDLIDIRNFGPIVFRGDTYTGFLPEFIIEDNATGIDRVLIDLDGDNVTDFEIQVEDADGVLTSADIDWIPYPT